MRLILAEKPSVALDIARALGSPQKHDGYVTVGSDTITWAYGHLVTLANPDVANPEQYDPAWKRWSWTTLPMLPDPFQLTPIAKTARRAHLSLYLSCIGRQETRRPLVALRKHADGHSKGVRGHETGKGLRCPRPGRPSPCACRLARRPECHPGVFLPPWETGAAPLGGAGTNAHTEDHRHRDQAIAQFQPTPYWQLSALFHAARGDYTGIWQDLAGALAQKLPPDTPGRIDRVEKKAVTIKPPFFFHLNDLQKRSQSALGPHGPADPRRGTKPLRPAPDELPSHRGAGHYRGDCQDRGQSGSSAHGGECVSESESR